MSLPVGIFRAGFAQILPLEISIAFWATTWLFSWLTSELILQVLHRLLRPWNTPIFAEIVLSVLFSTALASLYFPILMQMASQFSGAATELTTNQPGYRGSVEHITSVLISGTPGIIAWILLRSLYAMLPTNLVPDHWFPDRAPPKRPDGLSGERELAATRLPRFMRELMDSGITDVSQIVAIQANDHYVNVYLRDGKERLILSRFSDAIEAMDAVDGLRIHRSYWIRRDAIDKVERDGSSLVAYLETGKQFPVSAKYSGLLEHIVGQS